MCKEWMNRLCVSVVQRKREHGRVWLQKKIAVHWGTHMHTLMPIKSKEKMEAARRPTFQNGSLQSSSYKSHLSGRIALWILTGLKIWIFDWDGNTHWSPVTCYLIHCVTLLFSLFAMFGLDGQNASPPHAPKTPHTSGLYRYYQLASLHKRKTIE